MKRTHSKMNQTKQSEMKPKSWNQACLDYLHESFRIPKPCCSIIMAYHGTLEIWEIAYESNWWEVGKAKNEFFIGLDSEFRLATNELKLASCFNSSPVNGYVGFSRPAVVRASWMRLISTDYHWEGVEGNYTWQHQLAQPVAMLVSHLHAQLEVMYCDQGWLAYPCQNLCTPRQRRLHEKNERLNQLLRLAITFYCEVDHLEFRKVCQTPISEVPIPIKDWWDGWKTTKRIWHLYHSFVQFGLREKHEAAKQFVDQVDQIDKAKEIFDLY